MFNVETSLPYLNIDNTDKSAVEGRRRIALRSVKLTVTEAA